MTDQTAVLESNTGPEARSTSYEADRDKIVTRLRRIEEQLERLSGGATPADTKRKGK